MLSALSKWYKSKNIIKAIGPGFIIASVVLGPGSLTVSSRIGALYGYSMLWVIIVAIIPMLVYTSMSSRFGMLNENTIMQTISDKYGRGFAIIIGVSAFLSASSFQFGNNLGIGIGMFGITGIDERFWSVFFTLFAVVVIFWTNSLYKILEKIMMSMVIIMIVAFISNLILVKPNVHLILGGFLPSSLSIDHMDEMIAIVATTFSLMAALFQSYLVQGKKWKIENFKESVRDNFAGIFILGAISMIVIITSAASLYPLGIKVNSASDMALQLESLFGSFAKYVFSMGLCAAAFSSLMVNSIMGGCLLSDSIGLGKSMDEKYPKIFTTLILITGMLIAFIFKGNIIYALIMAQASSILCVPLIALAIFLIANDKKIMREYVNNKVQNLISGLGLILICMMVYFVFNKMIMFIDAL